MRREFRPARTRKTGRRRSDLGRSIRRSGSWAGTMDWKFPLLPHTELSGEFFTGRGIDGFGGLPLSPLQPANAYYYASVSAPALADIGVIGGWTQFKYRVNSRNEFNVAVGSGGRNSGDLRSAGESNSFLLSVPARNQMLFA